jgi:plastocyanin
MSDPAVPSGAWRRLLTGMSILVLLVSLFVGILFFPTFVIVSGLIIAGLVFTRMPGRLGTFLLVLGFLFTLMLNIGYPGTMTAFKNPGSPIAFIPRVLAFAGAITGLVAGLNVLTGAEGPSEAASRLRATAIFVMVAGIALSAFATLTYKSDSAQEGDSQIFAKNNEFTETSVQASGLNPVVYFENQDLELHTVTFDQLDVDLAVPGGKSKRAPLNAGRGFYDFYCRTHPDMTGQLVVG